MLLWTQIGVRSLTTPTTTGCPIIDTLDVPIGDRHAERDQYGIVTGFGGSASASAWPSQNPPGVLGWCLVGWLGQFDVAEVAHAD